MLVSGRVWIIPSPKLTVGSHLKMEAETGCRKNMNPTPVIQVLHRLVSESVVTFFCRKKKKRLPWSHFLSKRRSAAIFDWLNWHIEIEPATCASTIRRCLDDARPQWNVYVNLACGFALNQKIHLLSFTVLLGTILFFLFSWVLTELKMFGNIFCCLQCTLHTVEWMISYDNSIWIKVLLPNFLFLLPRFVWSQEGGRRQEDPAMHQFWHCLGIPAYQDRQKNVFLQTRATWCL